MEVSKGFSLLSTAQQTFVAVAEDFKSLLEKLLPEEISGNMIRDFVSLSEEIRDKVAPIDRFVSESVKLQAKM